MVLFTYLATITMGHVSSDSRRESNGKSLSETFLFCFLNRGIRSDSKGLNPSKHVSSKTRTGQESIKIIRSTSGRPDLLSLLISNCSGVSSETQVSKCHSQTVFLITSHYHRSAEDRINPNQVVGRSNHSEFNPLLVL